MPVAPTSNFVLNSRSVIMCPHGGHVRHSPSGVTSYRVDGALPLLLGDVYPVVGCPFSMGLGGAAPCIQVQWATASSLLFVGGRPALLHSSVGICMGGSGGGPAIVAAIHSMEREPGVLTMINN